MSEEKNVDPKNENPNEVVLAEQEAGTDTVRVSSEVIAILAGTAASEVKGLAGMSGSIVGGIAEKLGRKDFSRGIKVTLEETKVYLDLHVIVEYGYKIQDVAEELKNKVRSTVEDTTGLQVVSVNVFVQGIHLPAEKEEGEKEKTE